MKLDGLHSLPRSSSEIDYEICTRNVTEFAKKFVQNIIQEAIKQSSQTAWLIHCSENCHRLDQTSCQQDKSFLYWTPESSSKSEKENEDIASKTEVVTKDRRGIMLSCNSLKINTMNDNIYSLPVDSLHHQIYGINSGSRPKHYKTLSNCNKCFKPKAIHALNVIKSTHHKTFNDFKLFLINLYSSNEISVKKIGSEHSAFTKYRRHSSVNKEESLNDVDEGRSNSCKQNDGMNLTCVKNEKDLMKPIRKCNRIKRRHFFNMKHSFCGVFKNQKTSDEETDLFGHESINCSFKERSLPPVPNRSVYAYSCLENDHSPNKISSNNKEIQNVGLDYNLGHSQESSSYSISNKKLIVNFARNIERVKDYGWYWGPMSSEAAEKLLVNEPDGSFIVRDSSDDRYIFSLTFKLHACVRHVRIEHGQGNFSFGNDTNFKSDTIVDFIENAVQHSRSGRYLFFIHRRPILGPMRVLLLYPVSRFKGRVQSLQHMCRFVILKTVRRDLIPSLPLPKPLIEYLGSKDYYTEQKF